MVVPDPSNNTNQAELNVAIGELKDAEHNRNNVKILKKARC